MDKEDFMVKYKNEEYNLKDFISHHPGGLNYLQNFKGKCITEKMVDTNHASSAIYLLREYKDGGRQEKILDNSEDLEKLVDWNRAILPQVVSLGARYNEWVSAPVDRDLKLFDNPLLESLTITPWYVVPIFWTPIILFAFNSGINKYTNNTKEISVNIIPLLFWFVIGIILWTLVEYSLHRWVFHMEPSGDNKFFIYVHFAIHGLHHKVPFDTRRLVFPPFPAALIASVLYIVLSFILPYNILDLLVAGKIAGYVIYDMIHYYLHSGSPKENTYLYEMKRYHNQHHFSHADQGYGISNLYWDKIFGTAITLKKLAMGIKWR